jgi:circadian clock protein KaiB
MKSELRLYIAGEDAISQSAVANFRQIVKQCPGELGAEVIDIEADPVAARAMRVMATPMLVRMAPAPVRKVIGDLSDTTRVLSALGLETQANMTGVQA